MKYGNLLGSLYIDTIVLGAQNGIQLKSTSVQCAIVHPIVMR